MTDPFDDIISDIEDEEDLLNQQLPIIDLEKMGTYKNTAGKAPKTRPHQTLLQRTQKQFLPAYSGPLAEPLVGSKRQEFESALGNLFLKEMYRNRRKKQKKYSNYLELVKERIQALMTVMMEEEVGPIEAFFIFERDVALANFSLQWMTCALLEILEPSEPVMLVKMQREMGFYLSPELEQVCIESIDDQVLDPKPKPPNLISIPDRDSDIVGTFEMPSHDKDNKFRG